MNLSEGISSSMVISIKEYSREELREKMGLVLQDPFLFYGTVKDNIRLHNDSMTDEKVKEAAEFVRATSLYRKASGWLRASSR